MYFPKRLELSLRNVLALPKACEGGEREREREEVMDGRVVDAEAAAGEKKYSPCSVAR